MVQPAAEVIKLQGLAEAYELYGQAAMLDMIVSMLPEYAKQVVAPMGNIDTITVVDTGSSESNGGANKVSGYATNLMATAQESLKATTGLDIRELLENFSGKGNVKGSIKDLTDAVKSQKPVEVTEVEETGDNVEEG
ncbi:flotillin-like protein [Listeria rocourtiae]|uniref:Flotillin-like protein n=1 Tax=Listeria rocourtiae TaxID=647910 RepID=A0A4R6ZSH0_9LIST|nr:flotillin-like protein [Listeria rocourtiae FSL F6-920]TDR55545.1 flotillin-like protein [Listeria rocourtiae]